MNRADGADGPAVLVVDDDRITLETFEWMLTSRGFRPKLAMSVEEALSVASERTVSAVLLDLHLPVADGVECLRRLRSDPATASVPVAILTGDYFVDEDVATQLTSLGAAIHFKPIWEDDIDRIVGQLLRRPELPHDRV